MTELALEASSLHFSYPIQVTGTEVELFAFKDLHLAVPRGSIFGLLGPNGSGKSTFLQLILGVLSAGGGRLEVLGRDPAREAVEIRRRVGYVPQKPDLDPEMTVKETLSFLALIFGEAWRPELASRALDRFQLTYRLGEKVGSLSMGLQQRLALVAALAIEPEVLILDEPTAGLDAVVRRNFADAIIDYMASGEGRSVVLSSHLLSELEALVDHVGILGTRGGLAGTLVQSSLESLKEKTLVARVRSLSGLDLAAHQPRLLRVSGRDPVTAVFWLEDESERREVMARLESASPPGLRFGESSLEEIFVALAQEPVFYQRDYVHEVGRATGPSDV